MKRFALYALVFQLCALLALGFPRVVTHLQGNLQMPPVAARLLLPDGFSNRLYADSAERFAQQGDKDIGGFMRAFQAEVHIAAVRYIDGPGVERTAYPYISHFNMQYALGKWLTFGSPSFARAGVVAFQLLCITAMSLVVAGMALFARNWHGRGAGVAVFLAFALSPAMLARAASPYWVIALHFLPFVATLWLYPRMRSGRGLAALAGLLALLTCLKALTGYEYMSNIVLGPMLAVLYHELRAHPRFDVALLRVLVFRGAALGAGCVAGFGIAVGLHVWKAAMFFGSLRQGVEAFLLPLTYSVASSASGIRSEVAVAPLRLLRQTAVTFVTMNPIVSLPLYGGLVLCLLLLLARSRWSVPRVWSSLDGRQRALWVTLLASIPASLSWIILAQRHSAVHPHINWVLAYMYLNVFAAMALADMVARLRRRGPAE